MRKTGEVRRELHCTGFLNQIPQTYLRRDSVNATLDLVNSNL
jgi:hypothetical protein